MAADAELRIGTLSPLSGGGGAYGPAMEFAVRRQIESINAMGGVAGAKLAGFHENSETDPNAAVIAAKKLISVNQVHAIMGMWASSETLAVTPLGIPEKVAMFTSAGDDAITDQAHDGYIFRTEPGGVLWGKVYADVALKTAGAKTAAVACVQASYAMAYAKNFAEKFTEQGGTVQGEPVIYAASATSYRGELDKILADEPELVLVVGYSTDTAIMIKDAFRAGATAKWVVPGYVGLDPEFIKAVGPEAAASVYSADPAVVKDTPSWKAFAEVVGDESKLTSYSSQAYDQITLAALAVQATGKVDGTGIRDGIRQITTPDGEIVTDFKSGVDALKAGKKIKYLGASGNCDFDAKGNIQSGSFGIYGVEDGKPKLLSTIDVKL